MKNVATIIKIIMYTMLITALMSCAGTSKKESTGQYVDDSTITAKIKTAIFNDDSLKTLQITVSTFKGDVQLSGFVDNIYHVHKAGNIAINTEGVNSVINSLVVK